MPGRSGPAARVCPRADWPASTLVMMPASSHSITTSRAQPDGRSALAAKKDGMASVSYRSMANLLLINARIATMRDARYAVIEDGYLEVRDGRIGSLGPMERLASPRN